MKIVYVACEYNVADLFLPVASAAVKQDPGIENILVDPSSLLLPGRVLPLSPAEVFIRQGFEGEIIKPDDWEILSGHNKLNRRYLFYTTLFRRLRPSVVVVPHETGYAFYAVQSAKLLGIPTYHIQHGIWGPQKFDARHPAKQDIKQGNPVTSFKSVMQWQCRIFKEEIDLISRGAEYCRKKLNEIMLKAKPVKTPDSLRAYRKQLVGDPKGRYSINSDRMAVCGPYYKRQLLERKPEVAEDRIDVVGLIKGDALSCGTPEPPETIYKKYKIDQTKRVALYFYSPFQEFTKAYDIRCHPNDALIDAVKALRKIDQDISVLVLLHPNFRYAYYKDQLNGLIAENRFRQVRINRAHNDHFSLYRIASIIIGVKSATLYEAMLLNIPIVVQNYVLANVHDPQHIEAGAAAPVFSRLHLETQLQRALLDTGFQNRMFENQKMLCSDLFGSIDGASADRTARAIVNHAAVWNQG